MKAVKPVELFLSLGLVATLGACNAIAPKTTEKSENETATPATTVTTESSAHSASGEGHETSANPAHSEGGEGHKTDVKPKAATSTKGGEGGEGGESGITSDDSDADYATTLSLMLGHLRVADELIAKGESAQAAPHIAHPVEELYGDVADELAKHGVKDFKADLNSLNDLIKSSPNSPEVKTQLQTAMKEINGAIAVIDAKKLKSPKFVMKVVNSMLKVAGHEYTAAIADNKITETVEYQDSRGFVMQSEMLYEGIADQLSPEAKKTIGAAFAELKTVWPSVEPPAAPVKTPQEVLGYIVAIESHS